MNKIINKKWVCTDPDTEQYGRQLTDVLFEFREKNRIIEGIDISHYSNGQIEECINTYGYTLYPTAYSRYLQNIHKLYKEKVNWIIAECLFEMNM